MVKSQKRNLKLHLLALTALCFLFFLPFFIRPQTLTLKDNDLGRNYIPIFLYLSRSFEETKSIPLFRYDQFMGESLIASPLSTYFYPLTFIFLFKNTHFLSIFFYFIHFLAAALATFYLAKSFKLSDLPATAAALFYAFSTKMLLHTSAGHISMVAAFAYFPLGFLFLKRILEEKEMKLAFYFAFANWAILTLYPTIFYYSAIFYALFTAYFFLQSTKTLKSSVKILTLGLISSITLFGLSAINLLPQAEFSRISNREEINLGDVALPLWNKGMFFQSLIFPYNIFETLDQEEFLYLGIVTLSLSFLAFLKLRTSTKIFLSISAIFTLFFVLGLSTPLFGFLWGKLPYLNYSRVTTRPWFTVALIASILAASYLDRIRNKKIIYLIIILFLLETTFIGYKKIIQTPNLSARNQSLYAFIGEDRDHYRVYCTTYCSNPQLLQAFKIELANGESPIVSSKTADFLEKAGNYNHGNFAVIYPPYQVWQQEKPPQPNPILLGAANVKYVVSEYKLDSQRLQPVKTIGQNFVYRNLDFKERFNFQGSEESIKIEKYTPNSILLSFNPSAQERKLLIANSYVPGWFAFQNNRLFKVDQEDAFQSITVLPFVKSIELVYKPQSYIIGKAFTFTTILFLAAHFLYKNIKRRRI